MKLASPGLNTRLASKHKVQNRMPSFKKTTKLTTYPRVVNYLLRIHSTDKNIIDIEDEVTMFTQPPNKTTSHYAGELAAKTHRCGDLFMEHDWNEMFIRELDNPMPQTMRSYWALRKSAILRNLIFRATSLLKLRGGQQELSNSQVSMKFSRPQIVLHSHNKPINVIASSITWSILIWQQSESHRNLMAVGSASSIKTPSLTHPSTQQSSGQVSTYKIDSCLLCFDMTHTMQYFSVIPEDQRERLSQTRILNQRNAFCQTSSTDRGFKNDQQNNRRSQYQRNQYRWNEWSNQKIWYEKRNRWILPRSKSAWQPKQRFWKLSSKSQSYFSIKRN